MLSEQITVTTEPTSIRQLIATARGVAVGKIQIKCTGIMVRYGNIETAVVTLTDTVAGGGSNTGAVVLDADNEDLLSTSWSDFGINKSLLNCDSGTVDVHVIVTQNL